MDSKEVMKKVARTLKEPGDEAKKMAEARKLIAQYFGPRGEQFFDAICQKGLTPDEMARKIEKEIVQVAEKEEKIKKKIDAEMKQAAAEQIAAVETQNKAIAELREQAEKNEKKMNDCLKDIERFKQRMKQLEEEKARKEKERKLLKEKHERLKRSKEDKEKRYQEFNKRRKGLKKGSKEHKAIEEKMKALKKDIDKDKKDLKTTEKDMKNKDLEIKNADKELKEVSAKLDAKDKELTKLEQRRKELEEKKKELEKLKEQNAKRDYSADGRPQELVAAAPEKKAVIQTELNQTIVQQNKLSRY